VGKSTFINTLAGRQVARAGNEPAVTQRQQRIELGGGLILIDSPGILWPKFEGPGVGERLALSGAIKDTATDYAIHMGIRAKASVILCSPCCHKQLRPQMKSPAVLRRMKAVANRSLNVDETAALAEEMLNLRAHMRSWDMREGLTAFGEKRKPQFRGY